MHSLRFIVRGIFIITFIPAFILLYSILIPLVLFGAIFAWAFGESDDPFRRVYADCCDQVNVPLPYRKSWLELK